MNENDMLSKFDLSDGQFLINLARKSIEHFFEKKEVLVVDEHELRDKYLEEFGCFTTLKMHPSHQLRGCIGFPIAVYPLYEGIIHSAISAAFEDPRFYPLTRKEYEQVLVEVTILSPLQLVEVDDPEEYLTKIKVGRDGLVVEAGHYRGLLLPQVPVEEKWDEKTFLEHTCLKAGLPPNAWLWKNVKIYRFTGKIFSEETPRGKVIEIPLNKQE